MNDVSDRMEQLTQLTDNLPVIQPLDTLAQIAGDFVQYEMERGTCLGFGLLSGKRIGVQCAFLSADSVFTSHKHQAREWLLVYAGAVEIEIEDRVVSISVGESVQIDPNEAHRVRALEDTWLLGVAIPMETGYPNARKRME